MTTQQISEQVRGLIAEGELEDAANTLLKFIDQEGLSGADKARFQVYNQALHQVSQLNELKDQVIRGIISNEEADLKRNKIRAALLEIAEGIKYLDTVHFNQPASPPLKQPKKISPYIIVVGLIAIGLLAWVVFKVVEDKEQPYRESSTSTRVETPRNTNSQIEEQPGTTSSPNEGIKAPANCIIKTGFHTGLQKHPEVMEHHFMELPNHKEYKVLEVKKVEWANSPNYFFKIKHEQYEGWVRQFGLDFVSPECLD